MKIRKIFYALVLVVASFFVMPQPLQLEASGNTVESIDLMVDLKKDGSANITQVWTTDTNEGTEFYFDFNAGDMEIQNFNVQDETGRTYENIGRWDVDASIEEKAYKNGLVEVGSNHYEVAWGMNSYGNHTYTVNYTLTNFISSYSDYDGFNQRLINSGMATPPQKMTAIAKYEGQPLTGENSGIWAFGYDGEIMFRDGVIHANSYNSFGSQNYFNLMVRFNKGLFSPTKTDSRSFAEVAETAFEGSSYSYDEYQNSGGDTSYIDGGDNGSSGEMPTFVVVIMLVGFFFLMPAIIIYTVYYTKKYGSTKGKYGISKQELQNPEGYYREITFNGNIEEVVWALRETDFAATDGNVVGAFLLQMIYRGYIQIGSRSEQGFLGTKDKTIIEFLADPPSTENRQLRELYAYFFQAAKNHGEFSPNGNYILPEKVFQKWIQKNVKKITSWNSTLSLRGLEALKKDGYATVAKSSGLFGVTGGKLTAQGIEEVKYTYALKKFLQDYSLINERFPNEVHLWENYLVYASIFGIADQVSKDLKHMFPQEFQQFEARYNYMDMYMTVYLVNSFSTTYTNTYASATSTSSSGGGGFSSMGGGGGFSGGGVGGGAR